MPGLDVSETAKYYLFLKRYSRLKEKCLQHLIDMQDINDNMYILYTIVAVFFIVSVVLVASIVITSSIMKNLKRIQATILNLFRNEKEYDED